MLTKLQDDKGKKNVRNKFRDLRHKPLKPRPRLKTDIMALKPNSGLNIIN